LALRLAFLGMRYRQQANLTWDAIAAADATLSRWRRLVAQWAEEPSRPMCADFSTGILAAFDDDLDTPRALQLLRTLEKDPDQPPGSKFETFAWADRLLGLDLVRDVGKPPERAELPPGAQDLLEARAAARAGKDFAASDRLRDELAALGVAVRDTPSGQEWSPV
ncbi:MAG TPA: hypothetical protein VNU26_08455, partial [Mycobacteriales bacterium]|nr:hypothetical protein [Mycobacteriales bacterium]